jgi:hypothetical protein
MKAVTMLLLAVLLAPAAFADRQVEFSLGSSADAMFGHTSYDLELRATDPALLSKLEFPLDTFSIGVEARWDLRQEGRREWIFSLAAGTNLSAPRSPMTDGDYDDYAGYPPWLWSYTESDVAMRSLFASASAGRFLISAGVLELFAETAYRFQYIDQEALNYSGWQVTWNDLTNEWDLNLVSYPYPALKYTIFYHMASLGGLAVLRLAPKLDLEASAALLAVLASDRDDHTLRTKLSTATGAGAGYVAGLNLRYRWGGLKGGPYIALGAEMLGLRVKGTQTQRWYADTAGEPPAGTVYSGIPHIISSRQVRVTAVLGRRY